MKNRIQSPSAARDPLKEDREKSSAAADAESRGLVLRPGSRGHYADPANPDVTVARTEKDKLVTVDQGGDKSSQPKSPTPAPEPTSRPEEPQKQQSTTKSTDDRSTAVQPAQSVSKDKRLRHVDTSNTEAFAEELFDSQEEFFARSQDARVIDKPFQFSSELKDKLKSDRKFPVKYLDLLERMAGVEVTNETKVINYFTKDNVGSGRIESQAGELMTMVSSTMNDDEAEEFFDQLYLVNAQARKKTSKLCITDSWIRAAQESRYINRKRLQMRYGNDVEVTHGAWDNGKEVEALGLSDYKENKGFSTDMYLKIRVDGKDILNEISLKKDLDVKLFNSTPQRWFKYDEELTRELDPQQYAQHQLNRLTKFGKQYRKQIVSLAESQSSPEFSKALKSKKITLDRLNSMLENGPQNRGERKIVKVAMESLAEADRDAKQIYEDHINKSREYQKLAIQEFSTNEKMRDGLLEDIRKEFPLKAVAEQEEDMSLGSMSLDDAVFVEIFGTSNFDEIKEHLVVDMDSKGVPFIGYRAETKGTIIPLARIEIREDGLGYGGAKIRFDLGLDPGFRNPVKKANAAVYGRTPDYSKTARQSQGKQDVMMDHVVEIVREELRAYFKRKMLDMSESDYRKMASSMFLEADDGAFGQSGGGLSKPKDKKPPKKDDETPFDQVGQQMGGSGDTDPAMGGGGGAGAGGDQGQVGGEPNEKEKEMSKDLVKMAKPSIPEPKSALGRAVVKICASEKESKNVGQHTMNILDTNQARIIKYAKGAFKAYGYAKGLRAIETRLKDIYKVADEDVMNVASAVARILKADAEPTIDPLRRSPGHRQQYNPYNKGY